MICRITSLPLTHGAVSYTHLDVYKRQFHRLVSAFRQAGKTFHIGGALLRHTGVLQRNLVLQIKDYPLRRFGADYGSPGNRFGVL